MGFKRKKGDGEGEEMESEVRGRPSFNTAERRNVILPSMIKNKDKRAKVYAKQKHEKKVEKQKKIKARDAAEKQALELGEERGPAFISELQSVIPNSDYRKRGTYDLKKIVEYAKKKDYTSLIVVHTNRREPDALLIIGLPNGPTAHFKLSNLVLRKDIKNHGNPTSHEPELVLNNFTTRLGNRVGRFFQSLFPQEPNFRGRRVVTFHNQRDFIFFRHHRYIFDVKEDKQSGAKGKDGVAKERVKPRLQECGPSFTLKLVTLQHGTFDTKGGEFEWVHKVNQLMVLGLLGSCTSITSLPCLLV
ncbi:hypothetical protein F2Q70_00000071, partial [Brassica cretica]